MIFQNSSKFSIDFSNENFTKNQLKRLRDGYKKKANENSFAGSINPMLKGFAHFNEFMVWMKGTKENSIKYLIIIFSPLSNLIFHRRLSVSLFEKISLCECEKRQDVKINEIKIHL